MVDFKLEEKDYQEIEQAAKHVFETVLDTYILRGFDKQYQQTLLDDDNIQIEICSIIMEDYLDSYTTNPLIKRMYATRELFFEPYDELCVKLFDIIRDIVEQLIKEVI